MLKVVAFLIALSSGFCATTSIGKRACLHVSPGTSQHKLCVQQHWCREAEAGSSLSAALANVKLLELRGCPQYWIGKAREASCLRLCQGPQCNRVECAKLCAGVSLSGAAYEMYTLDTIGRLQEKFRSEGLTEKRVQAVSVCVHGDDTKIRDVFSEAADLKNRSPEAYADITKSLRSIGQMLVHLQDAPLMFLQAKEWFEEVKAKKPEAKISGDELARFAFFTAVTDALRDMDVDAEHFVKDVEEVAQSIMTTGVERFSIRPGGGGFPR